MVIIARMGPECTQSEYFSSRAAPDAVVARADDPVTSLPERHGQRLVSTHVTPGT